MSATRYITFFYSSTITVFSTHMFTSASKYLRATRKKKAQQMDMEQKQRLGNVIHGFFATFHYFNGVFGCLLFIYTLCLCMTITFLLSLVGLFAVPFRGISLSAHPSSDPACYAAGCPRRASIAWSVLATCISRMPPLHRSNDPRARSPPISAFYHPLSTSSW